jgi:hypothetical protein
MIEQQWFLTLRIEAALSPVPHAWDEFWPVGMVG